MTVSRDDIPLDALVEQERDLDEASNLEPGDELPDPPVDHGRTDADEGDLVEQSIAVNDSDDYPRGEE